MPTDLTRTCLYTIVTWGQSPLGLENAKKHLKVEHKDDDDVIERLVEQVTLHGEGYTGKSFRANTWKLLIDDFASRIELRKGNAASVTHVKYLVSAALVTVSNSVYYMKKTVPWAEILLSDGQSWPTDLDAIEHGVEIQFVTEPFQQDRVIDPMLLHLAHLYVNRGDPAGNPTLAAASSAEVSGANRLYGPFRTVRA